MCKGGYFCECESTFTYEMFCIIMDLLQSDINEKVVAVLNKHNLQISDVAKYLHRVEKI